MCEINLIFLLENFYDVKREQISFKDEGLFALLVLEEVNLVRFSFLFFLLSFGMTTGTFVDNKCNDQGNGDTDKDF